MKPYLSLSIACLLGLSACELPKKPYSYTPAPASLRLTLLPHGALVKGKAVEVDAKINNIKTVTVLTDKDLDTNHTQKIHLLAIDPTLTDYQHLHPQPTDVPGVYRTQFTPKMAGGYRVWADVTPAATHKREYAVTDMGGRVRGNISPVESSEATLGGYHFSLSFDKTPAEGDESVGTVHVTDAAGKAVASLQPVMGAYSHIVGFYDDFHTVVHSHPMGAEPKSESDRGGPDLTFHLEPVKSGFIKLFAQVNIGGKEYFAPFWVKVAPQK